MKENFGINDYKIIDFDKFLDNGFTDRHTQ